MFAAGMEQEGDLVDVEEGNPICLQQVWNRKGDLVVVEEGNPITGRGPCSC